MLNYRRVLPAAPGVDQVLEVIVANENANVDQLRDALPEKRAAPWPNVGFRELVGWVWDGFGMDLPSKFRLKLCGWIWKTNWIPQNVWMVFGVIGTLGISLTRGFWGVTLCQLPKLSVGHCLFDLLMPGSVSGYFTLILYIYSIIIRHIPTHINK